MNIGIAFDFDGVCTDLSFLRDQKVNEFVYLYSPYSIIISKKRNGIYELISVFGLLGDVFIITSRPTEDGIYIKKWLSKNNLLHLIKGIICCGDISKSEFMKQHNITLLIDDKKKHLINLCNYQKGVLWQNQSWVELAQEIFNFFILESMPISKYRFNSELILYKVDYLTDLGSSPVFILDFGNKIKFKLRVCFDENVKNRIINFLKITEDNNFHHVARLISTNGIAILKTFVEGKSISLLNENERIIYISKAGIALAKLHEINLTTNISDLKFSLTDDDESLLVFSADNYNMIVSDDNEVAFIDLEACNSGSRWIDFFWAERLLCNNESEKLALKEGYFSVYKGYYPCNKKVKLSQLNCALWIDHQLRQSKFIQNQTLEKIKLINNILTDLWANENIK